VSTYPRINLCVAANGGLVIRVNKEGLDLLVRALSEVDSQNSGFYFSPRPLSKFNKFHPSTIPYEFDDKILEFGEVILRDEEDDEVYYPHVLKK
jgi:hypothetical protein